MSGDPCAPHICPECTAGKCGNCWGDAWCNKTDALTNCQHKCALKPIRYTSTERES